jgi:acetyl esterase/lipase
MKRSLIWSIGIAALLSCANLAAPQEKTQEKPKAPPANLPKGVKFVGDLAYVEHGHVRNRLDLYLPEKAEDKLPLVVWIHGGGWQAGSKEGCPAVFLVAKGYVVASINYRLSQHAIFPAQIDDCKAAVRWLRANADKYHIDPEHIGAWGASAGGHLVALLGTSAGEKELDGKGGNADRSSSVQCAVDFFGPTDFVHWDPDFNKPVYTMITNLLGGKANENPAKARAASPLFYVDKSSAPLLIVHGDKDPLVPLSQSEALVEAMKKAGVEAKLIVIKGGGHGGPGFDTPENRKLIEEFFAKNLGKSEGKQKASATK